MTLLIGKPQPKVKVKSISSLKKHADKWCSIYVRQSAADSEGFALCYTCSKRAEWKALQAGHFLTRAISATRYELDNLRVQCAGCNIWGRGKTNVFADRLLKELGVRAFRKLLALGRETHQFTRKELEGIIQDFKEKVEQLDK